MSAESIKPSNSYNTCDKITFSYDPFDVSSVLNKLNNSSADGALAIFAGLIRGNSNRKAVSKLEYFAYESMARPHIIEICQSVRKKFENISEIVIQHKLGDCYVGQTGIVICVSSPHREQALLACHILIDEIKASTPIWKKEYYEDNNSLWVVNKEWEKFKANQ